MNPPTLFQRGYFTLHSGEVSTFKIECDALSDEDVTTLSMLLAERLPSFGSVEGVPRGGMRFAEALTSYATEGPLLIVDDVWTSGRSMERYRAKAGCAAIGAVVFARNPVAPWVVALFQLAPL